MQFEEMKENTLYHLAGDRDGKWEDRKQECYRKVK